MGTPGPTEMWFLGGSESTGCRLSSGRDVRGFVEWTCPCFGARGCRCVLLVAVN